MHFFERDSRRYLQFERLRQEPGLVHAFSTRPDDVSAREDELAAERNERRRQMARDLGLDGRLVFYCVQEHRTELAVVDEHTQDERLEGCDAVITRRPGVALMTFSADCPLVLVYDPRRRAVGLAHASWRCTVADATRRLVEAMRENFGCEPLDLLAGVGPSAGPDAYEVKNDVYQAAAALPERERVFRQRDGRLYFDLWEANRLQLVRAGVRAENIEVARICTMTRTDLFYSYRREGPGCGHFGLLAGVAG